jgi:hypothetical protein
METTIKAQDVELFNKLYKESFLINHSLSQFLSHFNFLNQSQLETNLLNIALNLLSIKCLMHENGYDVIIIKSNEQSKLYQNRQSKMKSGL